MRDPIPVAVVGAGNMGANHVRVYDGLPEADLVEVVEPDEERAREIRENYDTNVINSIDDLSRAQAVSIAVPNSAHRTVAEACASKGYDLLIEKPLALNKEDAKAIVSSANAEDVILQVGHIERFNPAVQALQEILQEETVIAVEAHRLGPFNEHLTTESVVFDLMIHDLDVVHSLVPSALTHFDATGTASRSENIDHAIAQFKFENGVIGSLTASHVTHGKTRSLKITTHDAFITVDYQSQDITIQRRGTEQTTSLMSNSGYRTETVTESPYIRTREPLKNELEHFLEQVRTRGEPAVTGGDGVRAVELATDIVESIQRHGVATK